MEPTVRISACPSKRSNSPLRHSERLATRTGGPSCGWRFGRGLAVELDAVPLRADDEFAARGIEDRATNRFAVIHQRDADGVLGNRLHELTGTVDRIDDPDAPALESREVVLRFLRQPTVVRKRAEQLLTQDAIGFEIGRGDGIEAVVALLVASFEALFRDAENGRSRFRDGTTQHFEFGGEDRGGRHEDTTSGTGVPDDMGPDESNQA